MAMTIPAMPRPRFLHMPFRSFSAPSAIIPTAIACSPSTPTIILRTTISITSSPFCFLRCARPWSGRELGFFEVGNLAGVCGGTRDWCSRSAPRWCGVFCDADCKVACL